MVFAKTEEIISGGNFHGEYVVILVAKIQKLWNVSGGAGIKLEPTQLVLRTTERPKEESALVDEAELLF